MNPPQQTNSDQASRRARAALEAEIAEPSSMGREETYSLSAMALLQPADRLAFAATLRDRVARRDARAALSAGRAGWHELADTLLLHAEYPDWFGLCVRRALVALGRGESVFEPLIRDLDAPGPMQRLAAVTALADITPSHPRVTDALLRALDDPDLTVYRGAYHRWIRRLQLDSFRWNAATNAPDLRTPLERLDLLATSGLDALRRPARTALKQIFQAISAGADPESLHLRLHPTVDPGLFLRLGRALFTPKRPIPIAELRPLTGAERLYAEALLARALERWSTKSVVALTDLGARWALDAIREAARRNPPDDDEDEAGVAAFRDAAAKADVRLGPPSETRTTAPEALDVGTPRRTAPRS